MTEDKRNAFPLKSLKKCHENVKQHSLVIENYKKLEDRKR
tara:strand:- start:903 stop:1022 length:120 start_codon:yes stop_codon:yes gene_type:complete